MSRQPAYITLDEAGYLTLYEGDGTEISKTVLWRGPQVADHRELALLVEDLIEWAEAQGYEIVAPAYDLSVSDDDLDALSLDENS